MYKANNFAYRNVDPRITLISSLFTDMFRYRMPTFNIKQVIIVVVVVASNDEGHMEAYGAVQNELMVTS